MREERGLNKVGDVVRVGLQIRYLGKESPVTYVNIRVVPQDYSKCLQVRIANAVNEEVRVSRQQDYPVVIRIQPENICA